MLDKNFSKQVALKDGSVVTLRFPTEKDIQPILDVVNELVEEDTFFLVTEKMTYEQEEKFLAPYFKAIEESKAFFLYATIGDNILGWVSATEISPRSPHAREIGVALKKEYRGKGLGKILMEEGMHLIKTGLDCDVCVLTVADENEPAITLYEKLGFIKLGKVPNLVKFKGKLMGQYTFYKEL